MSRKPRAVSFVFACCLPVALAACGGGISAPRAAGAGDDAPSEERCDRARKAVERGAAGDARIEAVRTVAACDEAEGKSEAAIGRWRQVLAALPGDREAVIRLGALLLSQGRAREAAAVATEGLDRNPREPALHMVHAQALEQDGDTEAAKHAFEQAARLYEQRIARAPEDPRLRLEYGLALIQMKRPANAAYELRMAVAYSTTDAETLARAAVELGALGDLRACVDATDRGLAGPIAGDEARGRAVLLRARAICHHALGDDAAAAVDADASLALRPDADLALQVARWDLDRGDRAACRAHAERAAKIATDFRRAERARLLAGACADKR
jgi:tetratricopeptide (TPR) repeat protein